MFIEAKDDGGGGDNWTTGAISRAKLQPNHHHQQTNIQFFTGRVPFLSPNQQCQSIEGKNITFHGFAYPKLTWGLPTLSLTTNSSWLPWERCDASLISPLKPVPHHWNELVLPNSKQHTEAPLVEILHVSPLVIAQHPERHCLKHIRQAINSRTN